MRVASPGADRRAGAPADVLSTEEEFDAWWSDRLRGAGFEVTRIPFAELEAWSFEAGTGNLRHDSGRFFTVEALETAGPGGARTQPIINQPEIGMLGILVQDIDGEPHCLMQAKMEPGNVNGVQLSPTVQATRSNYTRVHRGARTRHLEYFTGHPGAEVLADSLQSEQGAWFWRKRNRNVVVRVDEDVEPHEDFRWLPLTLVRRLLRRDNLINMDARTVLSALPAPDGFDGPQRHTLREIRSWLIEAKTACEHRPRLIPLAGAHGWHRTEDEIAADDGRQFRILAARIRGAGSREVAGWTQPLLHPRGHGLAAFAVRRVDGTPHLLAHARAEPGLMDLMEIGPTVQLRPGEDPSEADPFVAAIAAGTVGRIRYDALQSEEGGRFHHALTRYRVVEVGDEFPSRVPPGYCWVTAPQLIELLRHGPYLNIEARSLLAGLHGLS